ncbi:RHOMBOID protein [Trifolium repens]|nr:RHOMBOID protein [Trifolium repens]
MLISAIGINFFMKASGNDVVIYYLPEVFKVVGIRIRVGLLYMISGLGGSLASALFYQSSVTVDASGALVGSAFSIIITCTITSQVISFLLLLYHLCIFCIFCIFNHHFYNGQSIRVRLLYLIYGLGGSLASALFYQSIVTVDTSGALVGLARGTISKSFIEYCELHLPMGFDFLLVLPRCSSI